jgi:hypothetical protein
VPYEQNVTNLIQAGITALLAVKLILIKQVYTINKVSLSRKTGTTKLFIDQLMKTM